jgi:imidazolonepropionase-like amidohydrolase
MGGLAMHLLEVGSHADIYCEKLWDGRAPYSVGPATLSIRRGKIARVSVSRNMPAPSVDLSGMTVLPALLDCHVHLTLPGNPPIWAERVKGYLHSGIIAVRDAGGKEVQKISCPPLHIAATGQAISRTGFYGSNLGAAVDNLRDALTMVDSLAARGARQIKVIASGIFSFSEFGKVGAVPFSVSELSAIVGKAREHRLPVMAHASGDTAVRTCLKAGVHSVEHGYFMSAETVKIMAERGIAWVPTLAPVAAFLDEPSLRTGLTQNQVDVVRRSLEKQQEMVHLASGLGVILGAGTDAGAPGVAHGLSLCCELGLLKACGLTPVQVLRAATSHAALICGMDAFMGTVEPGKHTYLIAVRGNPFENLSALHEIECIIVPHHASIVEYKSIFNQTESQFSEGEGVS